jgi:hypothetical protein
MSRGSTLKALATNGMTNTTQCFTTLGEGQREVCPFPLGGGVPMEPYSRGVRL